MVKKNVNFVTILGCDVYANNKVDGQFISVSLRNFSQGREMPY